MSDETRTPNANTVRSVFVRAHPFSASTSYEDRRAEFDRFINKVRADALREAGQGMRAQVERATEYQRFTEHELIEHGIEHVLNEYADRIESGDGQ